MSASLILASASEARAGMLRAAGVALDVHPARIDEAAVKAALVAEGAPPRDIATGLAEMKAQRVSARHPGRLVLGADQVLVHEGRIFDKPATPAEAQAQLRALRGAEHRLLSAAVIALDGTVLWRQVGMARLTMRPFSDAFLAWYLDAMGASVTETVGCYRLEGLGSQLFSRVEGDYFTVLGLPLLAVLDYLRAREILIA